MSVNPYTLSKIISYLCTQQNIKVKAGKQWSYDVEDDIIEYDKSSLYHYDERTVIGLLMHEIGHAKFSSKHSEVPSLQKWTEKYPHSAPMAMNIFEDMRIEEMMRNSYNYGSYYLPKGVLPNSVQNDLHNKFQEYQAKGDSDYEIPKLINYGLMVNLIINNKQILYQQSIEMFKDKDVETAIDKTKVYFEPCFHFKTTEELAAHLDKNIFPVIEPFMEEMEKDEDGIEIVENFVQKMASLHGNNEQGDFPERTYQQVKQAVSHAIPLLKKQLSHVLLDTKYERYAGSYTTGKLNKRRIYKTERMVTRLFQRKTEQYNKDYQFGLLVDYSGSMFNEPFMSAQDGMVLFSEVLGAIDGVEFCVSGYSNNVLPVKKMNDAFDSGYGKKFETFSKKAKRDSGGTNDARALEWMYKQLDMDQAKRKAVIVLTDGQSGSNLTDIMIKYRHAKIPVYLVGINVREDNIDDEYENKIVVKDVYEIPYQFAQIIKQTIRR